MNLELDITPDSLLSLKTTTLSLLSPPTINGNGNTVCHVATCSEGTYSQTPTSISIRWLKAYAPEVDTAQVIDGQVSNSLPLSAAGQAYYVCAEITAIIGIARHVSRTSFYGPIEYSESPVCVSDPALSGSNLPYPLVSDTISVSEGLWYYQPTEFSYQWQLLMASTWTPINNEATNELIGQTSYEGLSCRCVVTATNACGATSKESNTVVWYQQN